MENENNYITLYGVCLKNNVCKELIYIEIFNTREEAEAYIEREEKRVNAGCSWLEIREYYRFANGV